MNIHDEDMTPFERAIKKEIEVGYGKWPEIIGLILAILVILIMFASSDGNY